MALSIQQIERFYRESPEYLEMLRSHDQAYLRGYVEYVQQNLPASRDSRILELGCGTGLALDEIGKNHFAVGLDISGKAMRAFDVKCKFVVGNAVRLPFKDGTFDVICSNGLLESISDVSTFFEESFRVMRRKGLFLVIAPDLISPTTVILRVIRYVFAGRIFPTFVEKTKDVFFHPIHFFYLWSKKLINRDPSPLLRNPLLHGPAGLDADAPYLSNVFDVNMQMKKIGLIHIRCSMILSPTIRCRGEKP